MPDRSAPYTSRARRGRSPRRARPPAPLRPHRHAVRPRARAVARARPGQLELGRMLVEELHAIGLADARAGRRTATSPRRCRRNVDGRAGDRPARAPRHEPRRVRARASSRSCTAATTAARSSCRAAARVLDPERMPELREASATTSSPRAATRCSAPTTRPAWPRSWPRSPTSPRIPELPRPTVRVGFTPDEEIGKGAFAVRHRGVRRRLRVHARRLGGGRVHRRDVHAPRPPTSRSTASTSTRAWRPASSSTPRGSRAACWPRCRRTG